jgi:excisionase family DNA binding protein
MTATATGDRPADGGATAPSICRRLFSIEQAADFAGVPVQEIWRRIRMGKLKVYHLGGGRVRIDEADLLANFPPRELEW